MKTDNTTIKTTPSPDENNRVLKKDNLPETLPPPVKKWLIHSGATGKELIETAWLKQTFYMKFSPQDTQWTTGKAEQFFTIPEPSFIWDLKIKMNRILPLRGRDSFSEGKGKMIIKLLGLIPVVNVQGNLKINESTLQRFLAEMMWFPSAALSPWITWEEIDHCSARAHMTWKGTTGSGVFYFNEEGDIESFKTKRFKDINDSERTVWAANVLKTEEREGIRIPVSASVSWELKEGEWTWAKITVDSIKYNTSI